MNAQFDGKPFLTGSPSHGASVCCRTLRAPDAPDVTVDLIGWMKERVLRVSIVTERICRLVALLALGGVCAFSCPAAGGWEALPPGSVRLDGETGALFDRVLTNNCLKIDLEKSFFKAFRDKSERGGFLGLGKLAKGRRVVRAHLPAPVDGGQIVLLPECQRAVLAGETREEWRCLMD